MQSSCLSNKWNHCITLNQGSKRVYPFDDLAASVLGFVNAYDNRGAYGLESYYNKILTGSEGRIVSAKNGQNGEMPFQYEKLYESQDGNSLVLTIDEVIQHFVEKHLEIAVVEHDVKKTCDRYRDGCGHRRDPCDGKQAGL